ncbi:DNA adenine methylase [Nitratidesulfovibrio sp. SRB-5]|uniref:DNA adenine methylase n=1 Tax=Nitratidesulfovibrio sp. SRB-5 TaxID=2872636 RepID=UPI001026B5B0|nr:DNA adenine methylase [Nitratidesulfovibrio sp. SRB-5]MBZ2172163.1 DNA adenine methylase [Nitratidesulfovibrio sp. SRB-5]RXF77357.1 DNA adenine methylase [Desulfovibrio sp. DS-1]
MYTENMAKTNSLLRYPGGKSVLTNTIANIFQMNDMVGGVYVEPYAGGAGIAMNLLLSGVAGKVIINDADPAISAFWRFLVEDPYEFALRIDSTPISVQEWHRQKEVFSCPGGYSDREIGFATFYLNRCNRSGILGANPVGGINQTGKYLIDARFPKKRLIALLEKIAPLVDKIEVHQKDALDLISAISNSYGDAHLLFLDPPYFLKGATLYMNYYKEDDHAVIARKMKSLSENVKWVVTYDDVGRIRQLYDGMIIRSFTLHYRSHASRRGEEIFISPPSLKIPEEIITSYKYEV